MQSETDQIIHEVEFANIHPPEAVPLPPMPHPKGCGTVIVARDGYRIHELAGPNRGRRSHAFDDVASFARWLNRHADPKKTEILVDGSDESIVAALDPSDDLGDLVSCSLPRSPSFEAWSEAFQKSLDQAAFHRLVIANAETLGDAAEGFAAMLLQVRVATEGNAEAKIDPLGYQRIVGGSRREEAQVTLPPRFSVTTPIFDGIKAVWAPREISPAACVYPLDVFLTLSIVGELGDRRAVFALACPGRDAALRQARRDVANYLGALLLEGFEVGLGTLEIESVPQRTKAAASPAVPVADEIDD